MRTLAPLALLWDGVPGVREVLHVPVDGVVPPQNCWQKTVVIPLMESHMGLRPVSWPALAPSDLAVRTLADKAAFFRHAQVLNLTSHVPAMFDSLDEAQFPCVLKRTDLNSGKGVEIVTSRQHAEELMTHAPFAGKSCILQALVRHTGEFVAHCVCKDGRILWHCVYFYEPQENAPIQGPAVQGNRRRAVAQPGLLAVLESFLTPLAFSGPCNADYTLGPNGEIILFEINPRLGGSLMSQSNVADLRAALSCIIQHAA
ncbi:MAG: hypothetical protein ABIT76_07055 [Chthoniobacterales bacterium]